MNCPGAHAISAAGRLKIRRPFLTSRSPRWREVQSDVEYGRTEEELGGLVATLGRAHQQLLGNCPIAHMKAQRLFWAQAPVFPETIVQVAGYEGPKGCIPACAFACRFVRSGRGVPALHHFADKSGFKETLSMRAREPSGPDGNDASILQFLEGGQ